MVEKLPGSGLSSPHSPSEGGAVLTSLLALFLCVPGPLTHCLEPDRKPGRPGPASERRPFLLLCDFLFRPAAILQAPGGPALIRVPACSRAVPEGCAGHGGPPQPQHPCQHGVGWRGWSGEREGRAGRWIPWQRGGGWGGGGLIRDEVRN